MIGIYEDSFVDFLRENLGEPIKINSKNIICRCPWCEMGREKSHYHLYISLDVPLFNCFHSDHKAMGGQSGVINKLIKKINNTAQVDNFVDREEIKNLQINRSQVRRVDTKQRDIVLPDLKREYFKYKDRYLKERFRYANISSSSIPGLVFDIEEFIKQNNIVLNGNEIRLLDFLQSNFVGFLTENKTQLICRNIDKKSNFRYYKLKIQTSELLDYYKIYGQSFYSDDIVLAEGIFDIYSEKIFNSLELRDSVKLYASALSSFYGALLKSIVFYEQMFRVNVHILSDSNIKIDAYKKLKYYNKHIINKLYVYYNRSGSDFNDIPINPEKFII